MSAPRALIPTAFKVSVRKLIRWVKAPTLCLPRAGFYRGVTGLLPQGALLSDGQRRRRARSLKDTHQFSSSGPFGISSPWKPQLPAAASTTSQSAAAGGENRGVWGLPDLCPQPSAPPADTHSIFSSVPTPGGHRGEIPPGWHPRDAPDPTAHSHPSPQPKREDLGIGGGGVNSKFLKVGRCSEPSNGDSHRQCPLGAAAHRQHPCPLPATQGSSYLTQPRQFSAACPLRRDSPQCKDV